MNNGINTYLIKPLLGIVRNFNLTLLIVVIVAGLISAILLLNSVLDLSPDQDDSDSSLNSTSFDDATIERLKRLRNSSDNLSNQEIPAGRINPFAS